MKKLVKGTCMLALVVSLLISSPVYAGASDTYDTNNTATAVAAISPRVISADSSTGVQIIQDAAGGIVISGIPTPVVATVLEQQQQVAIMETIRSSFTFQVRETGFSNASANHYDTENNPIHIGTWNGVKAYARHTLGTYNSGYGYLTSYGDCSWYNTVGNAALPYRNGAATVSGQDVVDVKKGSYFDIRDIGTDGAMTLKITDWGPDQKNHPDRIADIDKNDFKTLHGNTTDGLFYCRTWVPIENYNP